MTVRASTDAGTTWRPVHTVDGLPAAYSDLVRIDDDTVRTPLRDRGLRAVRDDHVSGGCP